MKRILLAEDDRALSREDMCIAGCGSLAQGRRALEKARIDMRIPGKYLLAGLPPGAAR